MDRAAGRAESTLGRCQGGAAGARHQTVRLDTRRSCGCPVALGAVPELRRRAGPAGPGGEGQGGADGGALCDFGTLNGSLRSRYPGPNPCSA